jgi:mono/diheme cytochrome c family protein
MFDTAGVLIIIVLIALFGFLTTRAWKLKNGNLKWGGVIIAGVLTLMSTAMLVLALVGFYKLNERFDNPIVNTQVTGTAAQIARGEQLAHICTNCHTIDGHLPLSGTNFIAEFPSPPMGTLYGPNLTPAGNIKNWIDGEVIRAIREGVHQNGRALLIMPSGNFRNMSDDDVQALVAYLRSQPATGEASPTNHFNLLGALFLNLSDFRSAQQPVGSVIAPITETPEHGKYMVDIFGCRDCHGDQLQGRVENGLPGPTPGPNLTLIVPQWTEEQFMTFFNTGELPGGWTVPIITLPSGFSEPRMPWSTVRAATTDEELKDIYAYLHSLPIVEGPAK